RPFPQPGPSPRSPSWELSPRSFVSLVEMLQGWKARSTSNGQGPWIVSRVALGGAGRTQPAGLDSAGRPGASMGADAIAHLWKHPDELPGQEKPLTERLVVRSWKRSYRHKQGDPKAAP